MLGSEGLKGLKVSGGWLCGGVHGGLSGIEMNVGSPGGKRSKARCATWHSL